MIGRDQPILLRHTRGHFQAGYAGAAARAVVISLRREMSLMFAPYVNRHGL